MSLRDEFLKANLINKKQAKQLAHEDRVEQKKLGREGIREKREQEIRAVEAQQQEKKLKDKQQAQLEIQQKQAKELILRVEDLIKQGRFPESSAGPRKFHFVTRWGKIWYIMVSDTISDKLERGELAVVEVGDNFYTDEFVLVQSTTASQLLSLQPEVVCYYQAR